MQISGDAKSKIPADAGLDEPQILTVAAQPIARFRLKVPRAEIRTVMGPARAELLAAVAAQGIATTGPWFTHHFRMDPATFDFEVAVPVASPIRAAGRVEPAELRAATVARTIYRGPFERLGAAWGSFDAWIVAAGRIPAEDLWECYIKGPESGSDPSTWETQLNRPLVLTASSE